MDQRTLFVRVPVARSSQLLKGTQILTTSSVVVCPHCGEQFTRKRSNKKYCQTKCQKAAHQRIDRQANPINAASSPEKKRSQLELFDTADMLAEKLYSLPVDERLGFVKDLIDSARDGNQRLREILTNKYILCAGNSDMISKLSRPDLVFHSQIMLRNTDTGKLLPAQDDFVPNLYWRKNPSYPNITQAAELYCQRYWGVSTKPVVYGQTPEPDTGEFSETVEFLINREAA